jgi:hypothetical protein
MGCGLELRVKVICNAGNWAKTYQRVRREAHHQAWRVHHPGKIQLLRPIEFNDRRLGHHP